MDGQPLGGKLTYTPAAGEVLGAGNAQSLTVGFAPTDTTNYAAASKTVAIDVGKAPLTIAANSQTKTYGATLTFAGTEFTADGLVNGDTVTSVTLTSAGAAATAGVAGSPYTITPSAAVGKGLENYAISTESKPTDSWMPGVYTVTATTSSANCAASSDFATLTIGSQGDSANGGGWTTIPSFGRLSFGFAVQKVDAKCTTSCTYKGQFVMVNNGKWHLKGTLSTYAKTDTTTGSASGTGDLYRWDQTLNDGHGNPTVPSFSPIEIKGGNLTVR